MLSSILKLKGINSNIPFLSGQQKESDSPNKKEICDVFYSKLFEEKFYILADEIIFFESGIKYTKKEFSAIEGKNLSDEYKKSLHLLKKAFLGDIKKIERI